ncbi:nucleotide sugar dehydrogenase [Leifsonia shinshuensis]|uniref:UDP-glucose 6-dehydrogenase n=1 Tax=Leifsonia shinshuensis TaxID=150026 RepID=A0A853CTH7_9MICO|nr:UDPglucose 6-dehydrogenase [Leifsonia shinshuensis]
MRLSVVGCGYLGAVHAAAMADLGHDVVGIDVDAGKIERLSRGEAPFFEPGLQDLLHSGLGSGRLRFTTDPAALASAELHFIAVGTPQRGDGDGADLSFVDAAFAQVLAHGADGDIVVGKSTVPVGTVERLAASIPADGPDLTLAWNPEFLREGHAVADSLTPDRLVFGVADGSADSPAAAALERVYARPLHEGTPLIVTDWATAELVKVAANAFLATKISFINAMAEIAEVTGADVTQLADAIGHDARIGRRFLNAGVGFGGGCLPKDIRAFSARARELGRGDSVRFLDEVDTINLRRRDRVVRLAAELLGDEPAGHRIAVLGLAFKPDSDDVRDSPALEIASALRAAGAVVVAADPHAAANARLRDPGLRTVDTAAEALAGAELVILLTEWTEFVTLDPVAVAGLTAERRVIDARNALDPEAWIRAGWDYRGLGRRSAAAVGVS